MNRNEWEKQVYASDLSTTARMVAVVVGSFGNWTEDKSVWPSTKAIADMAGMHRDTAQKYMDAFVEQGWLSVVKVRPGNIKEYDLCQAVAYPLGILAKPKRGGNLPSHQATDPDEQLPNHQATEDSTTSNQLPNHQASSCLMEPEQLPNGAVPVAYTLGTNLNEPTNKNLLELPEATVPDGPVPNEDSSIRDDSPSSPNFESSPSVLTAQEPSLTEKSAGPAKFYPLSGPAMITFKQMVTAYRASEEQATEALKIIQCSPQQGDLYEAVCDALRASGVAVGEDW